MRLWSLNPKYLDRVGLLAAWRESLLAKKVLLGKTKGYKNHPQLERFKNSQSPVKAINNYLWGLYNEAKSRQYNFKLSKIGPLKIIKKNIKVSRSQLKYEFEHLMAKLEKRDNVRFKNLKKLKRIQAHPLFKIIKGKIADWEKIK